ncbi:PH (Pleckstrin Homology) domain-containing protein [Geodermatophilus tzadiensis]|uniref:PH (Pleckstrin Homology) domain-containing protein n=1 Tax=Geodermatophilus tzadiensis TaxID=1137988 RepID=A0A2T0U1V9_9ACTN|nr:PH domain-containing protein [Geodermatophilus tzadiensis]PRY51906.1 PH (Pleckstrin Homology) domain-containing protein [Geodermatophilus tzadiensis]
MPYPDKLLADDEEVVRHLHPHWTTLFWPVVRFLLVVGAGSYLAALVPAGDHQGVLRLVLLAVAVVLLAVLVGRPVLRWRTTSTVLTTQRLLLREGVLARRGRDLPLSRVTDVSFSQTLWERVVRSGTVTVESAGEGGPTVLRKVPDSAGVQQLLSHLVEEDADRRERPADPHTGPHAHPYDDGYDEAYDSWADPDDEPDDGRRRWRRASGHSTAPL